MHEIITELIQNKKFGFLKKELEGINPADLVEILEDIEKKNIPIIFRVLPKEQAAEVFVLMDSEHQRLLIDSFSDEELRAVMDELFMDDTVDIIEEMPASVVKRILKQTDRETRNKINQLLAYPDNSVGSIMTTEYVDLKRGMTVNEAIDRIRKIGEDAEDIYTCYVVSNRRRLLGVISVKDLLLNSADTIIDDIFDKNVIMASTLDNKEEVTTLFEKYDLLALPVVDSENRLIGIVTVDDAIDVMQEAASEDIEMMAAILPSERPYLKTGVFEIFRSRIPWLLFLMISATFTGAVISGFEDKLSECLALIAFIPMLMGTGGNSGSQSSVTVIRALSLGDIEFKDIFKVFWKELRVSVICGVVLGIVNLVKLYLVDYMWLSTFDKGHELTEMLTVCLTLVLIVIVAKLVGSILPIVAKKLGLDPAVMASPLVTTILDAVSLMIYFGLATVFIL